MKIATHSSVDLYNTFNNKLNQFFALDPQWLCVRFAQGWQDNVRL